MIPEIERFAKWLRRKAPHASTHIHYANDMELFFAWAGKLPADKVTHVDAFIAHCPAGRPRHRHRQPPPGGHPHRGPSNLEKQPLSFADAPWFRALRPGSPAEPAPSALARSCSPLPGRVRGEAPLQGLVFRGHCSMGL